MRVFRKTQFVEVKRADEGGALSPSNSPQEHAPDRTSECARSAPSSSSSSRRQSLPSPPPPPGVSLPLSLFPPFFGVPSIHALAPGIRSPLTLQQSAVALDKRRKRTFDDRNSQARKILQIHLALFTLVDLLERGTVGLQFTAAILFLCTI
ncbi:hypothetical protein NUW54_g10596 [Trametes sanguinea]|uniref:Uncharacterized protein n=1 Tax=Trametes sanguinea TaxID=158606 RepID=A0ACC1NWX6_9APHY|nr:hypothetical protein NUW54_g10596 [Trametes sanguinea]